MKKLFPIFILFLIGCNQQEENVLVVGSSDKFNVVYIGVDNPIDIAVSGVSSNLISAKTDTTIAKIEGEYGRYILKVKKRQDVLIKVFKKEEDAQETLLDSFNYRVKLIPNPKSSVSGVVGMGSIKKNEMLKSSGLEVNWGDMVFELNMPIVYYSLSIPVNGKYISIEEDGPQLNEMMKKYIQRMETDQKIMFEDVTVRTPDGSRRKIEGVVLKVRSDE